MHIAICDDSAHDRKSLCRALQAFSAENSLSPEIDSIEDGAFLLAMEPELLSEIDLFFLDIYMERSNGFDIARALRTRAWKSGKSHRKEETMKEIRITESKMSEALTQIDTLDGLSPKDSGYLRLLTEEMFSMCKELLGADTLDFEVKRDNGRYAL